MKMRRAGVLGVAAALAGALVGSANELPYPALDAFEPAAASHLREVRNNFERTLAEVVSPAARAEAYGELAMVYYGYELNELAAAAWSEALEVSPDDGRWLYLLGLIRRIDGDWPEAAELLERAVDADPSNLAARIHLGRLMLDRGDVPAAATQFAAVREVLPTSAAATLGLTRVALAQGRYDEAVQWGRRTLALEPSADVAHHHIGLAYRALGDRERARRHLALSRHRDVSIPDPLTDDLADLVQGAALQAKHGVEAARAGRHDLAERYFTRAANIDATNPSHRYNLAVALREAGRTDRAIVEMRRLVEGFPEHRDGHFNLASLLAQDGDVGGAARHFERAMTVDPADREARIEWAAAISHLGRAEEAESELRALVAAAPDDAESRLALATLLLQHDRGGEAQQVLAVGLEGDVSNAEWAELATLRARAALESGDEGAARRDLEAAVARAPEATTGRLDLGRLLARSGDFTGAAQHFRRLVDVAPAQLDYQLSLVLALQLAGAREEMVATLEEAVGSLPGALQLQSLLARELVSCDSGSGRDVARGLDLARRVMQVEPTVDHAETVAAALALNGDFTTAVSWQERVAAERAQAEDQAATERSRRRLADYRRQVACPGEGPSDGESPS